MTGHATSIREQGSTKTIHIITKDGDAFVPRVRVEFNGVDYHSNEDGVAIFDIWIDETHARFSLIKTGYETAIYDIDLEGQKDYYNCFQINKEEREPDIKPAGIVSVSGENFRIDGQLGRLQGVSCFWDLYYFINGNKNEAFNEWARKIGANTKRVFGSHGYDGLDFNPLEIEDYFVWLDKYCQYQQDQGFIVEIAPLCRAEVFDTLQKCQDFTYDCSQVFKNYPNVMHNIANEPYKNLPKDVTPQQLVNEVLGDMWDLGSSVPDTDPYQPPGPYITTHAVRDDQWVRKARQDQERREQFHKPIFSDEPMGADSVNQPGSRSNVPTDFYQFHALASMYYSNLIHFTAGRQGRAPDGKEKECVEAGAKAWKDVPTKFLEGNFLYITKNIPGEKSYGVELGNEGMAVIVHPNGDEVIPEAGWRITSSIDGIVYFFERV